MGIQFIDNYTIIHFIAGILVYYIGISYNVWLILLITFKIIEPYILQNKFSEDNELNQIGDHIFGMLGWIFAHYANKQIKSHA
uniref:Uncharacterized protein n=1 Tax=Mimivirus LCMiAC01 TaxID=2506608 RepID=A0A481Z022_9VIRU|nr:MAG: hypothetical protein LCMiAC01_01780 [Mimivirus LCMiAC01]